MGQDLENSPMRSPKGSLLSLWGFSFIYIYIWLDDVVAVAEGSLKPGGFEYQAFELVNG